MASFEAGSGPPTGHMWERIISSASGLRSGTRSRAIFAVPGHCADGVIMGCFFGLAYKYRNMGQKSNYISFMFLALFVPFIEHGLYDSALSLNSDAFGLAALLFDIVFIIIAMIVVKKMAKRDEPLKPGGEQSHPLDMP